MSFSSELKVELSNLKLSECCRFAELCGMMMFGQSFSQNKISILSDTKEVASNFGYLLKKCFSIKAQYSSSEGKRPMYKAFVPSLEDRKTIIDYFTNNFFADTTLKKDCCRDAFIRGAFLVCGQIQNPEVEHRAEFRIKNTENTEYLYNILIERGIILNKSTRQGADLLYTKKSETTQDLVTAMGAFATTLELIDVKMIKELRNDINRRNNAELSNTSRVIEASIIQRNAIKYLIDNEKFEILPDDLKEIALLRMANPEASLTELSRLSSVSITRSGLNHRLKKIIDIVEELKEKR